MLLRKPMMMRMVRGDPEKRVWKALTEMEKEVVVVLVGVGHHCADDVVDVQFDVVVADVAVVGVVDVAVGVGVGVDVVVVLLG